MQRHIRRRRKWQLAFSLTEMMAVTAIVTSIPAAQYSRAKQKATQLECQHNLEQIGKAILMYQMGEGKYPEAVFYPAKPFEDDKSIAKILDDSGAGIPREMWQCPAAPDALRKLGLTFIYNDKFAGRRSLPRPERAWLLIELNCVSAKVTPPHPQGYNILFADGHVVTTKHLPPSITAKQKAQLRRIRRGIDDQTLASVFSTEDRPNTEAHLPHCTPAHPSQMTPRVPVLFSLQDQRIRYPSFGKSPLPLNAGRACPTRSALTSVTRPRMPEVHPQG